MRSGEPFNLSYSAAARGQVAPFLTLLGFNVFRPNITGDPLVPEGQRSVTNYLSRNNVSIPLYFQPFGNAGRNTVRGFAFYQADVGVSKRFVLTERFGLQFKAEVFNELNKSNFPAPIANISSPAFGTITSAYDARRIQLSLKAVLCGTPNHGVMAADTNLDMEFNGKGHFLRQLNEGSEVVDGVRFLTIHSDKNDKYAQPNVGYDAPELKGAENVVLPGLDHREVAFHPLAFAETFRFIAGEKPKHLKSVADATPKLSGLVTSVAGMAATNRPMSGVKLTVFVLKPGTAERDGEASYSDLTNDSGAWGPLVVQPNLNYEFRLERDGRVVTYFMSGLARSTSLLNFRFAAGGAEGLTIHRPQGYLSKGRDFVMVDGKLVEELTEGIPTRDSVTVAAHGGVKVSLRGETVHARAAESDNETNIVELIWD